MFIGSTGNSIKIVNNVFSNNVVGVFMDSTNGSIGATVLGNTIVLPVGTADIYAGVVAIGSGVTATIGGSGADGNTLENYTNYNFIKDAVGSGQNAGTPHQTIPANTFTNNGRTVPPSLAIQYV